MRLHGRSETYRPEKSVTKGEIVGTKPAGTASYILRHSIHLFIIFAFFHSMHNM
jgi:hypothetical protein